MLALRAAHRVGIHGFAPPRALHRFGLSAPRGFASTAPKLASLSSYRPNVFDPPAAPSPISACSSRSSGDETLSPPALAAHLLQRHTDSVQALAARRSFVRRQRELDREALGEVQRRLNNGPFGLLPTRSSEADERFPSRLPDDEPPKSTTTQTRLHADAAPSTTPSGSGGGSSSGAAGGGSSNGAAGATDRVKSKNGDLTIPWHWQILALMMGGMMIEAILGPHGLDLGLGISPRVKWGVDISMEDRIFMDLLLPLVNDPEYKTIIPVDAVLRDIREHIRRAPDVSTRLRWLQRELVFTDFAGSRAKSSLTIGLWRDVAYDRRFNHDPLNRIIAWNAIFGKRDYELQTQPVPRAPRLV